MAGFAVSINGWIWVSTEGGGSATASYGARVLFPLLKGLENHRFDNRIGWVPG